MKAFAVGVVTGSAGDEEPFERCDVVTREVDSMKEVASSIQEMTSARPNWRLVFVVNGEDLPKLMEGMKE